LNYDRFLETALGRFDSQQFSFQGLDDYVNPRRQAKVIKVHGSVNWASPMSNTQNTGWRDAVASYEPAVNDIIAIDNRTDPSSAWRNPPNGDFLYPRLTAPVTSKSFVCPENHTNEMRAFLADCHKFLVIGTSGLDDDLLSEIATCCTGSGYFVQFVSPTPHAVHGRFAAAISSWGNELSQSNLFDGGFTVFLDGTRLEDLLAVD
jgi:hypothetical protein